MNKQRYFVLHLGANDPDRDADRVFEIQILDSKGRAAHVGIVGHAEQKLIIDGKVIPLDVLEAARRQEEGKGDYVDAEGNSINPFSY